MSVKIRILFYFYFLGRRECFKRRECMKKSRNTGIRPIYLERGSKGENDEK